VIASIDPDVIVSRGKVHALERPELVPRLLSAHGHGDVSHLSDNDHGQDNLLENQRGPTTCGHHRWDALGVTYFCQGQASS
jgi:hypothetical protein